MDHFTYRTGRLHCEDISVLQIAKDVATPVYIYSKATIRHHLKAIKEAFAQADPLICYSVKANSTLGVLGVIQEAGCGFDVVSGGELSRVFKVGGDPSQVVYAGVGKTDAEIRNALTAGILMFNVESPAELEHIAHHAEQMNVTAGIAIRVNPDVDPETHTYITTGKRENKFGIDITTAAQLAREWKDRKGIAIRGIHCHIGSQITKAEPYREAITRVLGLIKDLRAMDIPISYINTGGGFGIHYAQSEAPEVTVFADTILPLIKGTGLKLILEPGRFIVGNAGIFVIRVLYQKTSGDRHFAITDGGMNDLIRPSLYQAYHKVWPVEDIPEADFSTTAEVPDGRVVTAGRDILTDVVGPVCESGDFFAKERYLPQLAEKDFLAVFSAGAYCFSMSSNYNTRPRPAEVLVEGDQYRVIRQREDFERIIAGETL